MDNPHELRELAEVHELAADVLKVTGATNLAGLAESDALADLTPNHRAVLVLRLGLDRGRPRHRQEVAVELGIRGVRALEVAAVAELRRRASTIRFARALADRLDPPRP